MKKLLKKESGITLIALVITIIVLLILAGVSIAMLTGQNGLLMKAGEAAKRTGEAEIEEKIRMATQGALTTAYRNGQSVIDVSELNEELNKLFEEDPGLTGNGPWTYKGLEIAADGIITGEVQNDNNGEGTIQLGSLNAKKDEYLEEARKIGQSSTNLTIGLDKDLKAVNMDLWRSSVVGDNYGNPGIALSEESQYASDPHDRCGYIGGYESGKIKGNVPAYVLKSGEEELGFLPVINMDYTFYCCSGLIYQPDSIPDSVTSIGECEFYGCENLVSMVIPDGVTSIGYEAFQYCSSLTNVTIPDSVTNIGVRAFDSCYGLINVTMSNRVAYVDSYAFAYCSSLTNLIIPNSVTSVASNAFKSVQHIEYHGTDELAPWGAISMN